MNENDDELADAVAIKGFSNGKGFDVEGMQAKKAMRERQRERERQAMHDRAQAKAR